MIKSCRLFVYDNFCTLDAYTTTCFNQNVSLIHPIYLNEAPSQRKKTHQIRHFVGRQQLYFLILLRCVIVQKQAVEVDQRLFVMLGLFKARNCWKTAILHLHLFKNQNIKQKTQKKTSIEGPTTNSERYERWIVTKINLSSTTQHKNSQSQRVTHTVCVHKARLRRFTRKSVSSSATNNSLALLPCQSA